ncbi:MAG: DEAD/DEAH box helicase [Candidatus Gracilibacteria bacterium]|nr:DEAD/DEAH box helicase [Candidatus Gracilibacteria bacterium]
MNFTELNLINPLLKALEKNNFTQTTQIQSEISYYILNNKDVIGISKTGSGKTFAFLLPFLNNLYLFKKENEILESKEKDIRFLILAPTRELAIQIGEELKIFSNNLNFKYDVIFGGVNQFHQEKSINKGLDILVATPGRLLDLLVKRIVKLHKLKFIVLDEADKMLDMGFIKEINKVFKHIPQGTQKALFTATMPEEIVLLTKNILQNPEKIIIKNSKENKNLVVQKFYSTTEDKKYINLKKILNKNSKKVIIFTNKKETCGKIFFKLNSNGYNVDYLHKDKSQFARQNTIKAFKNEEFDILVATDIVSRGIDIDGIKLVINYDLPRDDEIYVHRIGRTARAGKRGNSMTFVLKEDEYKIKNIEKIFGEKFTIEDLI